MTSPFSYHRVKKSVKETRTSYPLWYPRVISTLEIPLTPYRSLLHYKGLMRTSPPAINRFWLWPMLVVIGIVWLAETGCSTKTPKYPEDHARFQRVIQAIKTLEATYVNKDGSAFHELLLPLEQLEILEAEVRQDFSTFATIQLDSTIDRIRIDGNRISAFISWQGTW